MVATRRTLRTRPGLNRTRYRASSLAAWTAAAFFAAAGDSGAAPCSMTIPEQAIHRIKTGAGEPVEVYRSRPPLPVPLAAVVHDADVIVVASLRKLRTLLTRDRCDVVTDYMLTVTSRLAADAAPATEDDPPEMILRVEGGDLMVDGVPVIARNTRLRPPPDGEELVLLLKRSEEQGIYVLSQGDFGAFVVRRDRVNRLMRAGIADDFPAGRDEFIAELVRLSAATTAGRTRSPQPESERSATRSRSR
jgi:hypothetical protein